jgi:hypothetical protein
MKDLHALNALLTELMDRGEHNGRYEPLSLLLNGATTLSPQEAIGLARIALYVDSKGERMVVRSYDAAQTPIFADFLNALNGVAIESVIRMLPPSHVPDDIKEEAERRSITDLELEVWAAQARVRNDDLPLLFAVYVCGMEGDRWIDVWMPPETPVKAMWGDLLEKANKAWG